MFMVNVKMKALPGSCLKMEEEEEEDLEKLRHMRYGYLNYKLIQGLPKCKEESRVCKVCNVGEQQQGKFQKKSEWRA